MKTKHLFYSLALAAAFTACTQDEMFDAPVLDNNAVANRPVAGVVTLVNDDVDSRYNVQDATFENGDKLGLYLMDEFNEGTENPDANLTPWDWQSRWWKMYTMVNYISTNYGYVYNAETGEWVNRASQLVEGNYIALFPQNTLATNRRDLWHPINANVDLVAHTSKNRYYVGRDNQFFVGYEQIKRDQDSEDAEGNLTANISMKPILTYAKIWFDNDMAEKLRLKKVVFRDKNRQPLPFAAVVKPAGIEMTETAAQTKLGKTWNSIDKYTTGDNTLKAPYWAWNNLTEMAKVSEYTDCDNKIAAEQGVYDRKQFTQAAARDMVSYISNSEYVPYGMTKAQSASVYEYTFNFPENGVELAGNNESDQDLTICGISIALPAFESVEDGHASWEDMDVVVYADKWDKIKKEWVAGYISKKGNDNGEVNASFDLDELTLWESGLEIPEVALALDNEYFTPTTQISVSTSKDLYKLVEGRLKEVNTAETVNMTVEPYGEGLVVGEDLVALIDAYEKAHGAGKVQITFSGDKAPVILNAVNSIHKFSWSDVDLVLNADQTISKDIDINVDKNKLKSLTNSGQSTLTVEASVNVGVENDGEMIVKNRGSVGNVVNDGELTLGENAKIVDLVNNGVTNVTASDEVATVGTLLNVGSDNECNTCAKAELNVSGKLTVTEVLTNEADINITGEITVQKGLKNGYKHKKHAVINNNGDINGEVGSWGIVNIGNAEGGEGNINTKLINYAEANITAGTIKNLTNRQGDAVLNVWSEEGISVTTDGGSLGKIVFKGVENGHIGTFNGTDEKVFEIQEAQKGIESADLLKMMRGSGTTTIWTAYDITLSKDTPDVIYKWASENVTSLIVKGEKSVVTIQGEESNLNISQAFKATVIDFEKTDSKLVIANQTALTVNYVVAGKEKQIDVTSGSSLKNKSGNEIDGTNKHSK